MSDHWIDDHNLILNVLRQQDIDGAARLIITQIEEAAGRILAGMKQNR